MKKKRYLAIGLITIIVFFSIKTYSDYREKELNDVISYNSSEFKSMDFKFQGDESWKTNESENVEELIEFLGQYEVKKMRNSWWDGDVSKEKGFDISIYSKDNRIMASIYENRLLFFGNGDAYKVLNGPIDMDWVQEYNERNQ